MKRVFVFLLFSLITIGSVEAHQKQPYWSQTDPRTEEKFKKGVTSSTFIKNYLAKVMDLFHIVDDYYKYFNYICFPLNSIDEENNASNNSFKEKEVTGTIMLHRSDIALYSSDNNLPYIDTCRT